MTTTNTTTTTTRGGFTPPVTITIIKEKRGGVDFNKNVSHEVETNTSGQAMDRPYCIVLKSTIQFKNEWRERISNSLYISRSCTFSEVKEIIRNNFNIPSNVELVLKYRTKILMGDLVCSENVEHESTVNVEFLGID